MKQEVFHTRFFFITVNFGFSLKNHSKVGRKSDNSVPIIFTSNYRLRPKLHIVLSTSDQVLLFPAILHRTFDFGLFYYFGLSTSDEIKRKKSKVTTSDLFYHFDPTSSFRTIDFGPKLSGSKW